jgi:hypothetical protein
MEWGKWEVIESDFCIDFLVNSVNFSEISMIFKKKSITFLNPGSEAIDPCASLGPRLKAHLCLYFTGQIIGKDPR